MTDSRFQFVQFAWNSLDEKSREAAINQDQYSRASLQLVILSSLTSPSDCAFVKMNKIRSTTS